MIAQGLSKETYLPQEQAWLDEINRQGRVIPRYEVNPKLLSHLLIIQGGSRQAADDRNLGWDFGYVALYENMLWLSRATRDWGIDTTTFLLSPYRRGVRSRNQEQSDLMLQLVTDQDFQQELKDSDTKFTVLASKRLEPDLAKQLRDLEKETAQHGRHRLNMAINYTARREFERALKHEERIEHWPESLMNLLYNSGQLPIDLVIKTGVDVYGAYRGGRWIDTINPFPDLTPEILLDIITSSLDGPNE